MVNMQNGYSLVPEGGHEDCDTDQMAQWFIEGHRRQILPNRIEKVEEKYFQWIDKISFFLFLFSLFDKDTRESIKWLHTHTLSLSLFWNIVSKIYWTKLLPVSLLLRLTWKITNNNLYYAQPSDKKTCKRE